MAGQQRAEEMNKEWAETSKIGYEKLHVLPQNQRWPKIW